MKRALWVLPLLFVLGMTRPAAATPIVVSAGQSVLFNFNFAASGAVPAPPYAALSFNTGLNVATLGAGDVGTWDIFNDVNATGGLMNSLPINLLSSSNSNAGWVDGVFSATLTVTGGSVEVDPFAFGANVNGARVTADVFPIQPQAVPEPASLLLLGTGLVGAGARRWRTRRQRT